MSSEKTDFSEEWATSIRRGSALMLDLLPLFASVDDDPIVAAIAGLLLGRAVCCSIPGMPPFSELAACVAALPDPIGHPRCQVCGCTDASPCLFHVAELETEIACAWVHFGTKCSACVARERGELIGEVRRAPWNRAGEEHGT